MRLDNIRESDIAVAKNITERKSTIAEPDAQQSDLALQGSRRRAGLQALMALAVLGERCVQGSHAIRTRKGARMNSRLRRTAFAT